MTDISLHDAIYYGGLILIVSVFFFLFVIVENGALGFNKRHLGIPEDKMGERTHLHHYLCRKLAKLKDAAGYGSSYYDDDLLLFLEAVKYLGRDIAILDEDGNEIVRV